MTRIKICGLTDPAHAEAAAELGADYVGFVFEPASRRYVGSADWGPAWLDGLRSERVAVYGIAQTEPARGRFQIVQAVEWPVSVGWGMRYWQSVRLKPGDDPARVAGLAPGAELLLLDAYDPLAYGGTGHKADWGLAAEVVRLAAGRRVGLAGGLTPENVAEAVSRVRPWLVDVSGGVESAPGKKDLSLIRAFIEAARS